MFIQDKQVFRECGSPTVHDYLPSGAYVPELDRGTLLLNKVNFNSDEILELPQPEFVEIVQELDHFLKPSTKELFAKHNYVYKRSTLMYSDPGMGKSTIVMRVAKSVLDKGGLVFFANDPHSLIEAFKVVPESQTKLIIFEEFEEMIETYGEKLLLTLLDGEIQQKNVIYMSTTNHIDRIPNRFKRPGRHSTVIEIKAPTSETRAYYINKKCPELSHLVNKTQGLSIDELSEVIKCVACLGQKPETVISRLKSLPREAPPEDEEDDLGFSLRRKR